MDNNRAPIKQAELTRYAKAMQAAGVEAWRVDIKPDGTISIIAMPSGKFDSSENDWDSP
ncbi:hypothetical protein [Fluviibacterium sp. S390]|uniref:hypothetical protein n=1 Tax=Fluviibacterium sp. S390 TaxID=3415139 RepID=UPI003C7C24C1